MIQWFILLFLPIFFLIIIVWLGNKLFTKTSNYTFQKFKQFMIYFIEMYIVIFVGISTITYFESDSFIFWKTNESFFEYFQRGLAIFSTYQLFVFATLKLSISADKDSYLTYKRILKYTLHYIENDYELNGVKNNLEENADKLMYSNEIKHSLCELIKKIEEYAKSGGNMEFREYLVITLKLKIIDAEHSLETYNLAWMNSFLLSILK